MTCIILAFSAIMFGAVGGLLLCSQREKLSILRLMLFLSPSAFLSTFIAGILIEKDSNKHYNGIGNANASPSTPGKLVFVESFPWLH